MKVLFVIAMILVMLAIIGLMALCVIGYMLEKDNDLNIDYDED